MKTVILCVFFLLGIAAFQSHHYAPLLPDQIASHFNSNGEPDGWQSNRWFFAFYAGMLGVMLLSFIGLPLTFRCMPSRYINVPNKDYWFSEKHKHNTIRDLQTRMAWCGVFTLVFIIVIYQLLITLNLNPPPKLPETKFWLLLSVYIVFLSGWCIALWRAYRLPSKASNT